MTSPETRPHLGSDSLSDEEVYEPPPVPEAAVGLLAAATIVFPPIGLAAIWYARKAGVRGDDRDVRLRSAARSRTLALYSFGAAFSCLVLSLVVLVLVLNDFRFARDYFSPEPLLKSMPSIAKAFVTNLLVSVVAFITSVIWGLVLALARGLTGPAAAPVRLLAIAYIDIFRGLPILLTILIIGLGLPLTGLPIVKDMNIFTASVLAMTALYGAYLAELFRSGIESIHSSQVAGAKSLGLNYVQTMRFVVLPQAVIRLIPPLLGWYISVLKDTSLLSVLGMLEGVNVARIAVINQNNLSALTGVALCFLAVTIPLSRLTDYLLQRSARRRAGA